MKDFPKSFDIDVEKPCVRPVGIRIDGRHSRHTHPVPIKTTIGES